MKGSALLVIVVCMTVCVCILGGGVGGQVHFSLNKWKNALVAPLECRQTDCGLMAAVETETV